MNKTLALFDFDGTLTTKDSLLDFLLFSFGPGKTLFGGFLLSPALISYGLGLTNNSSAKQKVFRHFFGGVCVEHMLKLGRLYAQERIPQILRSEGILKIRWHLQQGHDVAIVSASTEYWLKPWTDSLGVELLATKLSVEDGRLTGNYSGENCHGQEKVNRIRERYDLSQFDVLYAYGDTSGDKPMLSIADHGFYKPFH